MSSKDLNSEWYIMNSKVEVEINDVALVKIYGY